LRPDRHGRSTFGASKRYARTIDVRNDGRKDRGKGEAMRRWWIGWAALLALGSVIVCCGGGDDGEGSNNWTDQGIVWVAPYAATAGTWPNGMKYLKGGTTVHLKGAVDASSTRVRSGQVIGTLPEGCRPPAGHSAMLLCPTWGWPTGHTDNGYVGTAGVIVHSDGRTEIRTVQQFDGEQQFLFLDGLSFSTVTGTDGWSNAGMAWTAPYTTGGTYPSTLEFAKSGSTIRLRGFANAGGTWVHAGQVVGTLPAGYRPPAGYSVFLLCPTWGWPTGHTDNGYVGTAGVFVHSNGNIEIRTVQQFDGEQQFLMFDGLSFSTVYGADGWTGGGMTWNSPFTTVAPYPSTLEYAKTRDIVRLQGFANAGSTRVRSGQVPGSLPAGYRVPPHGVRTLLCPTWGWPTGHTVDGYIGTAGVMLFDDGRVNVRTVQQYDGEQQFLAFDSRSFSTLD
jgi:hypothetical protein